MVLRTASGDMLTQRLHLVFEAQRTVDNAQMRYYIAHINRLGEQELTDPATPPAGT